MKYARISYDGGLTYVDLPEKVIIVFAEASEDDDEMIDVKIDITEDGIEVAAVGQVSGNVSNFVSYDAEDLSSLTKMSVS